MLQACTIHERTFADSNQLAGISHCYAVQVHRLGSSIIFYLLYESTHTQRLQFVLASKCITAHLLHVISHGIESCLFRNTYRTGINLCHLLCIKRLVLAAIDTGYGGYFLRLIKEIVDVTHILYFRISDDDLTF